MKEFFKRKKKEKKSLKEMCKSRRSLRSELKVSLPKVMLLLLCMGAMQLVWINVISVGAFTYTENDYKYLEDKIGEHVKINAGVDAYHLQNDVDTYELAYRTGQNTQLSVGKEKGYFKPTVTAVMDKNYQILYNFRDHNSLQEYVDNFWWEHTSLVFGGGFAVWLFLIILPHIVFYALGKIIESIEKIKKGKEEAETADQTATATATE